MGTVGALKCVPARVNLTIFAKVRSKHAGGISETLIHERPDAESVPESKRARQDDPDNPGNAIASQAAANISPAVNHLNTIVPGNNNIQNNGPITKNNTDQSENPSQNLKAKNVK